MLLLISSNPYFAQPFLANPLDSLVNLAISLSEKALYAANFEEARDIVDLSYFKRFEELDIEHEIQLTLQEIRVVGISNIVRYKRGDRQQIYNRLKVFSSQIDQIDSKETLGNYYLALSALSRSVGKVDTARTLEERALLTFKKIGDEEVVARIQANQISRKHNQYLRAGKKEEILELIPVYQDEIDFSTRYSKYALAYNTRHLGQIHRRQTQNYSEALRLFKASLSLREEIGFKPFIPASYSSLGDVYAKMGSDSLAIDMYEKAAELAIAIGFVRYQTYPYLCIGDIKKKQGEQLEAIKYYRIGLKYAAQNKYTTGIDNAIQKISEE